MQSAKTTSRSLLMAMCLTIPLLADINNSCHAQTMLNVLSTPNENTFVASSFINDHEGWLADNKGILWHTTDAGLSLDTVCAGKAFLKLRFTDQQNGFAIAEGDVYKSADGGILWESLQLDSTSVTLWFVNKNVGFVGASKKIYKTSDNGQSWITVSTEINSVTDFYFINELIGVATALDPDYYKSIWRTTDGGLTWTNVYNQEKYFVYSVWFVNESTGYAAGYFEQPGLGRLPAINKTTNGGLSWENIFRDDGIVNWGETFLDIRFKNEMEGFAVANFSQSAFTTDGGLSWTSDRETDSTGLPTNDAGLFMALDGDDVIYIAGKSGNLIKW
jgi:photosystem II stability/assembly factor-like uncharacterized protein